MEEPLSRILDRLVARKDVAHAVLAAARGDGSFHWVGARGEAGPGGAPMRADTPFFIASIDKLFNAAIVLRLHERGLVRLDEPVAAYLPASLIAGLHRLDGIDHTDRITVRHLLSHTSGLPDWLEDSPRGGRSLVERILLDGDREMSLEEIADYVRDRLTPHFVPQRLDAQRPRARYSDTNFMVLAAIIEAVSRRALHEVHEELLYRPLDLRHTWIAGRSRPLDPAPDPAALWAGNRPLAIPLLMRSFHGVYSTAGDMLVFLRALTRGGIFERPDTFDLMRARWVRFGLGFDRAAFRAPQWPIEYGLGLMRFRLPRFLTPFRPIPAVVGHTGSTGTWLFHCPAQDLLLAGTVDQVTAGPVPFRVVPRLLRIAGRGGS